MPGKSSEISSSYVISPDGKCKNEDLMGAQPPAVFAECMQRLSCERIGKLKHMGTCRNKLPGVKLCEFGYPSIANLSILSINISSICSGFLFCSAKLKCKVNTVDMSTCCNPDYIQCEVINMNSGERRVQTAALRTAAAMARTVCLGCLLSDCSN